MENVKYRWSGVGPQMMHNGQLANRLNPYVKKIAAYTARASKLSEEETFEKFRWEWEGSLYLNPETNAIGWPADNVIRCIIDGAKRSKLGQHVTRGVLEARPFFDLEYDGPQDLDKLWEAGRFADIRNVRMGQGKQKTTVQRCRPIFRTWSLDVELQVDTKEISIDDVTHCIEDAGIYIGLSDFRPRYGRFTAEKL